MYNLIFLYHGLLAMVAQLVIFRELSVLFYGNELFLGTFLSSWLLWVGLGSLSAVRLLRKGQPPANYFSYGFLALSLALPIVVLLIRLSKSVFSFGEFIGPFGTILFTFCIVSFVCLIIGAQFSLAAAIAGAKKKETALGRVYLCEALGAVTGGLLFTYLLIGHLPAFIIILILSSGCVFAGLALSVRKMPLKGVSLVMAAIAILFTGFKIEPIINKIHWRKYQLIRQREARNATFALVKMGSIGNVFVDGVLSASFPAPENYEPIAHWPMLAAVRPGRILIIGDASLGALKEVLKHNPSSVDYCLPDSSFLDLVRPYLAGEDAFALEDPRLHIHYGDPRAFVREKENSYDVVIINIQEVPNLKLNRFHTREFYGRIKFALKPGGLLGLGIVSSENYLSMQTRMFNASVYRTLNSVFGNIEIIPGDVITFLCGPSKIDMRSETILGRFADRALVNRYFIPSYIDYKLETQRRASLKRLLEEAPGVEINRDFRPTTFYYFAGFWLNKFTSPLGYLAGVILLVIFVLTGFRKRKSITSIARRKEHLFIFIIGFISILLELLFLLGFQIVSGYVYWQMGVLFAAFMSGLFLGALLGAAFKNSSRITYFVFLEFISLGLAGLSISARYLLPYFINLSAIQNIFIFAALLLITGAAAGSAFVIAGFLIGPQEAGLMAGSLYASDLWGAALGALFSTNFIIPFFGLFGALNVSAVMGLTGSIILLILYRGGRRL